MAKTRSMTRNQNHDDGASSSRKRPKSCAPWSDLDHNLLFLVIMQVGVVDFVSFSGVCKSWRSFALSNWIMFMASKPPMTIHVSRRGYKRPCYLREVEGRKFKTIIPGFTGGVCLGLTSGYLIFFRRKTRDFWLVNPITRRELRFPNFPGRIHISYSYASVTAVLVFAPSISQWVFAIFCRSINDNGIWFSIMGKGTWNHVPSSIEVIDLHAFKGKIYTLNNDIQHPLSQLILNPEPKMMPILTENFPCYFYMCRTRIASSSENIYVMGSHQLEGPYIILELDFAEMKWVLREKTMREHALFISDFNRGVAVKPESCADPQLPYWRYADEIYCCRNRPGDFKLSGENRFFIAKMWYFPHECLNVDC